MLLLLLTSATLALVAAAEEPIGHATVRKQAQELVDQSRLVPARKMLKAELQRLRELAKRAAGPAADYVQAGSQNIYLRLGHADTQGAADLLVDLGLVYQRLGQQSEALAVMEEAADALRGLYGERDPRYGMAADRLADAHVQNGDHAIALQLYQKLLEAMKKGLGRRHPGYQLTLRKAADTASPARKPKVATKLYSELLELMEAEKIETAEGGGGGGMGMGGAPVGAPGSGSKTVEETIVALASTRIKYAQALVATGRLNDALKQAEQARDSYADSPEMAGSFDHAASMNGVAGVLERAGRYDEAIEAMREAYELAKRIEGIDPAMIEGARKNYEGMKSVIAKKRKREEREL